MVERSQPAAQLVSSLTIVATGDAWSDLENDVCVAAYLALLEAELRHSPLVKVVVNQQVQETIGRSKGSIEYKFQNVSAVLRDLSHPFVRGYKPAVNYQDSLTQAVLRGLNRTPSVAEAAMASILSATPPACAEFHWSLEAPPVIEFGDAATRRRRAIKTDFVRLDAANRQLGREGELAVLHRERALLVARGRKDLSLRVEHVSEEQGDGLGFDVLSFEPDGTEKFIEVKTTRQNKHWPMLLSRNERDFSRDESDRFHLYRLFDFGASRTGLYTLRGDVTMTCDLDPYVFQALPKREIAS